jgi:tetratricopeptide (TPR) repeat protein
MQAAHDALAGAQEFASGPAEREDLLLLQADLVRRLGDPAKALSLLDPKLGISSRLWHERRAECLKLLQRHAEAQAELDRASTLLPDETRQLIHQGLDCFQRHDLEKAISNFDQVLARAPDHFLARLFQAVCFLRRNRPGEAKVALTACLAQRPRFVWCHLYRCEAFLQLGELVSAAQDLQRVWESKPHGPAAICLQLRRQTLHAAIARLPDRTGFWNAQIHTTAGIATVSSLPFFQAGRVP